MEFEILAGPDTNKRITYVKKIDAKTAPYVARDLRAAGWRGKDLATLAADVDTTHVEVTIEIKTIQSKAGKDFSVIDSIGRGTMQTPTKAVLADTNRLMGNDAEPGTGADTDPPF
jgi:hypothetical protein